jgi:hypothetical protein
MEKGDGPYTHGNSFALGPGMPAWLRANWELVMARQSQATVWDNLP